ncbi:MAG: DUF58 domain-containing protein [Longimicrobiales bacterium]
MRTLHARGTVPGSGFVDPRVLARISNLELVARTVVEGFINGLHGSPYLGLSLDFAEHRAYMPGDDIRRIDWRVYARTDRYYVKEFEADTNANFIVLLDVSKSMAYGSKGITKIDYGRFLAASLLYFSHQQRDRVGLVTFDDDIIEYVPPAAKHLDVVLHAIDRMQPKKPGRLGPPLRKASESLRRRGVVVLISDFYEEPDAVLDAVGHLRGKGNDLIVFHILDPAEIEFPFDEAGSFEDLETGERIPIVPETQRAKYRELIQGHVSELSKRLTEMRVDYALFDTATPLDYALFTFLSNRERLSRVR